jgi:oligopeptide/dipeptide ABC transporter ATP-binding protein
MLKIEKLEVSFPVRQRLLKAVRGVDIQVPEGLVTGLVGESGSGKSVSAFAAARLLPADAVISGSIYAGTEEVFSLNKDALRAFRGKKLGFVFQEPSSAFDPIYTIEKCFFEIFSAHDKNISRQEAADKACSLLDEAGIVRPGERLKNFPHQFSGGMLQRISLALALALDPEILIADEPTTALDVTIQAQILKLILRLKEKRRLTVLFITHDLQLLNGFADEVTVMYAGLVMESGPAAAVLGRPRHPYTRGLTASIPRFGANYKNDEIASIPGTLPDPFNPPPGCPFQPRCLNALPVCSSRIPDFTNEHTSCRCFLYGGA